jgi:hypothetical protein
MEASVNPMPDSCSSARAQGLAGTGPMVGDRPFTSFSFFPPVVPTVRNAQTPINWGTTVLDRDLVEENTSLLLPRWRLVNSTTSNSDSLRMGMDVEVANQLRGLDEVQVRRAADAFAPLFRTGQADDVLVRLITSDSASDHGALDAIDQMIQDENELFLLNRWSMARQSPPDCQCLFGLSAKVVAALRSATLGDLHRASSRGIRMAHLSTRHKYLFHAGRHVSLSTSMRTAFAVCATSRLKA